MRGQDTDAVLAEAGSIELPEPSELERRDDKPPLDGVRVMEMTNVIAGPAAGKCLGDLGADIIKFEPPYGDISRPAGAQYFLYLNSNKRSVSANTKTAEGQVVAQRIAAEADILLANMRPGATDRMGLRRRGTGAAQSKSDSGAYDSIRLVGSVCSQARG